MRNRRRRPNPLRSLVGAMYGLLFLFVGLSMNGIADFVCRAGPSGQCGLSLSGWMPLAWAGAVTGCFAWSAYRAYRDYVVGEYYLDLLG